MNISILMDAQNCFNTINSIQPTTTEYRELATNCWKMVFENLGEYGELYQPILMKFSNAFRDAVDNIETDTGFLYIKDCVNSMIWIINLLIYNPSKKICLKEFSMSDIYQLRENIRSIVSLVDKHIDRYFAKETQPNNCRKEEIRETIKNLFNYQDLFIISNLF